jgi:hypothetical protein
MDEIFYLDEKMGSFYAIEAIFQVEKCRDANGMWTLEFDDL